MPGGMKSQFGEAVGDLLAEPHVRKRIKKLIRDGAAAHRDEQHLFLLADGSASHTVSSMRLPCATSSPRCSGATRRGETPVAVGSILTVPHPRS